MTNPRRPRRSDEAARLLQQTSDQLALIEAIQHGVNNGLGFQAIVDLTGDRLRKLFGTDEVNIRWWDEKANLVHYLYEFEKGRRLHLAPAAPMNYVNKRIALTKLTNHYTQLVDKLADPADKAKAQEKLAKLKSTLEETSAKMTEVMKAAKAGAPAAPAK